MELLPRQSQDAYRGLLREHSIGLSLMDTPHPSLVPLEMASAGMLVVTSTFENKTAESLRAISENLIPVEPTVDGIKRGLGEAVDAIGAVERRIQGARVELEPQLAGVARRPADRADQGVRGGCVTTRGEGAPQSVTGCRGDRIQKSPRSPGRIGRDAQQHRLARWQRPQRECVAVPEPGEGKADRSASAG